jgi:ribosomal protein L29
MSEEELAVDIRESEKSLLKKRKKQTTQEVQTARDQRFHF